MLLLPFLPIAALIIQNSTTLNSLLNYQVLNNYNHNDNNNNNNKYLHTITMSTAAKYFIQL